MEGISTPSGYWRWAEIVNSCHLSNAEAELIMNLQAYRAALKTS